MKALRQPFGLLFGLLWAAFGFILVAFWIHFGLKNPDWFWQGVLIHLDFVLAPLSLLLASFFVFLSRFRILLASFWHRKGIRPEAKAAKG